MKVAFIVAAACFSFSQLVHAANLEKGKALTEKGNCSTCHGAGLNAPIAPAYPKIAGQYPDYLYYALRAYQVGDGNPQFGRNNAVMASQVKPYSDEELRDMSAYIGSLPGNLLVKK